jgi:hypothetical protein
VPAITGFYDPLPFWQARFDVLSPANADDGVLPCHFDRFSLVLAFVRQYGNP